MSRAHRALAAFSVLALTLAACSSSPDSGGTEGGTVVAYLAEPDFLDPALASTVTANEVVNRIFDPLINYDPETAEPVLTGAAESYTVADDGKSITFQLREGATFHNGEPVNAEAFVRALTRVASKDTASEIAYHLDGLKGFAALQDGSATDFPGVHQGENEYELVFEFDEPQPEFYIRTGHTVFSPIPAAALDDTSGFNEAPIGNGPYKIEGKWEHNQGIKVVRFDEYNGEEKGNLDGIEWKIFTEIQGGYLEFQGGTVDTTSVPPENWPEAAETYGDAFIDQETTGMDYLFFTVTVPPLDNPTLRQAISLAMDRGKINDAVFNGQRSPSDGFIPKANAGYREGACEFCTYDPDRAKQLFEESGVPAGTTITLTFNGGAGHDDWVQAAATQIQETLGLKTVVKAGSENFGDYLKSVRSAAGMFRLGWGQDYPTPDNWLAPFFLSTSGDNYAGYENPEFDQLIIAARTTTDEDERAQNYADAQDILVQDMPAAPMFFRKSAVVFDADKFANFTVDIQLGSPAWEEVSLA
ncbi:MAG: ABC transporter substrate-binding protein [Actinomycetota bacterium]